MIIYGTRASNIGNFDVQNTQCDYCEKVSTQKVSVFGRYFHIFWIPFFPLGKKAVAECTHCKRTIEQREFSPELKNIYNEIKGEAKRPFWHWLGLILFGLLAAQITIAGIRLKKDPRSDLLNADEELMTANPTPESDPISYKIKQLFDTFATEEMEPSEFKYLTKISGDKALILIQIPKLRKVKKEARYEILDIIKMVTDNEEALEGKDLYIGVKGIISMILIKTPTYLDNSRLAFSSELYEFYGPKPVSQK